MAQIKFFRGSGQSSVPSAIHDGNIYIVQNNGQNTGDIYVDISSSQRVKIEPEVLPEIRTKAEWKQSNFDTTHISVKGKLYIYSDFQTVTTNGQTTNIPGYKIGDGLAYIADLPIYQALTAEKEFFWNHKVDAYMSSASGQEETLILSYGLS